MPAKKKQPAKPKEKAPAEKPVEAAKSPAIRVSPEAQVWAALLKGAQLDDAREFCALKFPDENADKLIAGALARFASAGAEPEANIFGFCLMACRELYLRLFTVGDYAGALRAVEILHRLNRSRPAAPGPRPPGPAGQIVEPAAAGASPWGEPPTEKEPK